MSDNNEVTIVREKQKDYAEEGVVVPIDRFNPDTLWKLVEEFVTREWSDLSDSDCSFEDKIEQVMQQLKEGRINIVSIWWVKRATLFIVKGNAVFESQYNDEMEAEVKRLEAQKQAINAGHPEWINTCATSGCELNDLDSAKCSKCS